MLLPVKGSPWRAWRRLTMYFLWTFICMPVQVIALRLPGSFKARFPHFYHRTCMSLFGIQLDVRGQKTDARPVLFVSNHSSHFDIPVLSAVIAGSFVAKREVGAWPFVGTLARLQRTVFVERRGPKAAAQKKEIYERLKQGDTLILFPEGTSTDGCHVLPFKSSLFSAVMAEDEGAFTIQPVSVTATALDDLPLGWHFRPVYAALGDDAAMPKHLFNFFGLRKTTVRVEFHPPVSSSAFTCRKALAQHCWQVVASGVSKAASGR